MGDVRGGTSRARNVLQHGLTWMRTDAFLESLPTGRAQDMLSRLHEMQRQAGGEVGFSLTRSA